MPPTRTRRFSPVLALALLGLALTLACSSSSSGDDGSGSDGDETVENGIGGSPSGGAGGRATGGAAGRAAATGGAAGRAAAVGGGSATGGAAGRGSGTGGGSATGGTATTGTGGTVVPSPGDVVVTLGETHQTMDGFGASDNYNPQFSDALADTLFSQTKGVGLSLLRVSISPTGSDLAPVSNAQKAFARGAKIWTAPWSPPGNWKDNGSENNGGHLLAAHYEDWANVLAGVVTMLANNNVTVMAVSVQNEPDYTASYASCLYSTSEMVAFINVLAPKLAALSQKPKLMMPETSGWSNVWDHWNAAVANGTAAQNVGILAAHQYFLDDPPSHAIPDGKVLWQTEDSSFEGFSGDIGNAVNVSKWIHNAIVHGGVSAWHYWAIWGRNGDNEGLLSESGATTKRLFALGNFSKFVRPGFVRVGTTDGPSGTLVSAYKDSNGGAIAIVVINTNGASVPFSATLSGSNAASVTPWVTSAQLDLGAQASVPVTGGRFTTALSATSVTTFVSSM